MFGGVPKQPKRPTTKPKQLPGDVPGYKADDFGHLAREPNTCYRALLMDYTRRKNEAGAESTAELLRELKKDELIAKYSCRYDGKEMNRQVQERVAKKLEEYEEKINERRKELSDLLSKDEHQFYKEAVDNAQKLLEKRKVEQIEKIKDYAKQKEQQRSEYVNKMKLNQKILRCEEVRSKIIAERNRESRRIQLLQIEENKSKKEKAKETEHMWDKLVTEQNSKLTEREQVDRQIQQKLKNEFFFYQNLQAEEHKMREDKRKYEAEVARNEFLKLREDLEREEREYLENKQRKQRELANSYESQIKEKEELEKKRLECETDMQKEIDDSLEREKQKLLDIERNKLSTSYQDMIYYQQFLAEMKEKKRVAQEEADKRVAATMKEIQRIQDEKVCKYELKRKALFEEVLKIREKQIEDKRKRDEELKKLQDMQDALAKASQEQDKQMHDAMMRQLHDEQQKYRKQLKEQAAYNKLQKIQDEENEKKILAEAKVEDAYYEKLINDIINGTVKITEIHPFRQAINNDRCICFKPNY